MTKKEREDDERARKTKERRIDEGEGAQF